MVLGRLSSSFVFVGNANELAEGVEFDLLDRLAFGNSDLFLVARVWLGATCARLASSFRA